MANKNKDNGAVLDTIHNKLINELANYESSLREQKSDITDEHERYLRMLMLMIKSLETLERLDAHKKNNKQEDPVESQFEKLSEIQRRLARLADA
jgi:gluconate kinase